MPVESNIELGSGTLYFKGVDESIPIQTGQFSTEEGLSAEEDWADDTTYISTNPEPIEFTCKNAWFARDWTMVKCIDCGYEFPVTEWFVLLNGLNGWRCPKCAFEAMLKDVKKRSNV